MYASDLISRTVRFCDNLLHTSADGQDRRERYQQFLQEGIADLEMRRDFPWTYKENSSFIVTAAAQKTLLPADFAEIGRDGGVYIAGASLNQPLDEVSPRQIAYMRRVGRTEGPPTVFSIEDSDNNSRPYLQLANGSDSTLHLYYKRKPLAVIDCPLSPVAAATATVGNLSGSYNWAVSFVTASGESTLGFYSNQVSVFGFQVQLTNVPVSGISNVTSRKVYRTVNAGTVFKLVGSITDNVTTSLTDNVADGSLGAAHPTGTLYTGLEAIPEEYVYRVLIPYMRYRGFEDKGDVRGEVWKQHYEEGLGWVAKQNNPGKATVHQVTGYGLPHMF